MSARSYLYVPANNLEMLEKAIHRGSDALIIDLEDAVRVDEKHQARINFDNWLKSVSTEQQIWVRINSETIEEDLKFANTKKVTGIVVPKATTQNLTQVSQLTKSDMLISALIETADSILLSGEIAAIHKVLFLQIGILDLRAELGLPLDSDSPTLEHALSHLVLACAAAGIEQPIAPIFRDFNDSAEFRRNCKKYKDFGFFGRTAVHPKQIEIINEEFSSSIEEVMQAERILEKLESSRGAAVDHDGKMIDEASARIARKIVARKLL